LTVYTALVQHTDIAADRWKPCHRSTTISVHCTKAVYTENCSWRWASLSPETCRADSNRSI